ncbi:SAM-dependent methyltransferase [Spongiactinospora sp. 9N601]|uniref:SAM-dependent methyltransferase n=1 Tax=Spongiactinospora sp. 9N601 TaxID=3375149 RepID=UPI0037AFED4F
MTEAPDDGHQASAARIYNVLLGGDTNFAADRAAATLLESKYPTVRQAAVANRAFGLRAVRHAAEDGVDQFLDIGCGLPLTPNTHEVARRSRPAARVVYVDNDPHVIAHGNESLRGEGVATVPGDLRDPAAVLDHPQVRDLLDFGRPVAILAVAVMHFIGRDDDPLRIVATLRDACAPGSWFVLTHACTDTMPADEVTTGTSVYRRTATPVTARTRQEIEKLFTGFELLPPGLVSPALWRPEPGAAGGPAPTESLAGAGVLAP